MTTLSSQTEGEITIARITADDPYTEPGDGYKKLVLAALLAYDETEVVSKVEDETQQFAETLERRSKQYGWNDSISIIEYINPYHPVESFENFFEHLDMETDTDDRIILILVGHGTIEDNTFYFSIKTYHKDGDIHHLAIDSYSLFSSIEILRPAVDFIRFISCLSAQFYLEYRRNHPSSCLW